MSYRNSQLYGLASQRLLKSYMFKWDSGTGLLSRFSLKWDKEPVPSSMSVIRLKNVKPKPLRAVAATFLPIRKFRIGKRFAESVILATKEGSLLYSEAYQLTGLRGKTFDEFANSIGYEV